MPPPPRGANPRAFDFFENLWSNALLCGQKTRSNAPQVAVGIDSYIKPIEAPMGFKPMTSMILVWCSTAWAMKSRWKQVRCELTRYPQNFAWNVMSGYITVHVHVMLVMSTVWHISSAQDAEVSQETNSAGCKVAYCIGCLDVMQGIDKYI